MPEALLERSEPAFGGEYCFGSEDEDNWRAHLPARRSVFGSVEYANICEQFRECTSQLYVLKSEHGSICSPLLLRPVADLPFATDCTGMWDAATPDFTGPLAQGDVQSLIAGYRRNRSQFIRKLGIVSEFAHLHPWEEAQAFLGNGCAHNRDIIWVDVSLSPDWLFREHFEHAARKNIGKAQREGVKISTRTDDSALQDFYRIYLGTMLRNGAQRRYFFSLEFFREIRDRLPDNSRFVFAEHGGAIAAATLYMHDDRDVYSFLGGADTEFNHLRPTNLIVWETICWAHDAGKKRLILGGGFRPKDGIYQFKATFSPLRSPFHVYRKIHLPDEYALLDARCRAFHQLKDEHVDYFPSYRNAAH